MIRDDRGTIAPLVPVMAMALLLLGGLVIDASRLLNARGRAVAYAEEAARAGASSILAGQAVLELDEAQVRDRVDDFCRDIRQDDEQALGGGVLECGLRPPLRPVSDDDPRRIVVEVRVRVQIPATLLGMVGVDVLTASGEGRARPFEGVDPSDVDSSPPPAEDLVPEESGELPDVTISIPPPASGTATTTVDTERE